MSAKTSLIFRVGVLCAAVVALAVTFMGGGVLWLVSRSCDRLLESHLAAYTDVIVSQIAVKDGSVTLRDRGKLLDRPPRYWQVSSEGKPLYRSGNLDGWIPLKPEDPGQPQRIDGDAGGKDIVAVQETFLFPGNRKITLVSGLDAEVAAAYKAQEREALAAPLYQMLLLAGLVLVAACIFLVRHALRPLARVEAALQSIRAGNALRLDGDYPAEITALTAEINRLLDYMTASITRHREFSANLAHALKTPLTVIANETDPGEVKRRLRALADIVDRNLSRVYAAGTSHVLLAAVPVAPVVEEIAGSFGRVYGKAVAVEVPPGVLFQGDRADLYEILGNIIENACKFSRVKVAIRTQGEAILVEDDGAEIPADKRALVLQRGVRLDESAPGHGIGLAVAGDIVALYQGDIMFDTSALGGLKVVIYLSARR